MSKEKNTTPEPHAAPVTPTPALSAPPTAPASPDNTGQPAPGATPATDEAHGSHDSHPTTPSAPSADELIRQAYLRGRNEAIDELMRQPAMLQPLDTVPRKRDNLTAEPEIMILNSPRPSIWDK